MAFSAHNRPFQALCIPNREREISAVCFLYFTEEEDRETYARQMGFSGSFSFHMSILIVTSVFKHLHFQKFKISRLVLA